MDSCVLLAFLLFCWAEAASAPDPPLKSVRVGGAVTLPVTIPKGQSVNNLLLRDSSREIAIAIWMDSKDISVLNINYANRVAFQKDEMAFRIANLSLDDGGTYEISTSFTSPSPKVLSSFLVAIFNITERISSLENDSCYIYLQCEAGMGSSHRVTYAWKDTEAGTTLSKEAWLTQLVPTNQKRAYTCTAQSPTAQSTFSFVLQHSCIPNTASPGPWSLGSLLVRGLLVTATLLLLL
ncbi:T-lymphocyte surface antigen Ly-9-like isoform X2 [Ahaetulla prasina]|uniref:T-lymphocyte surface antigen Ly-9-like isoform X2 n=1 Tax=Ahaetulla prasina TaxID=499056 RepID=UPI0026492E82|nr:T-lymphocyte surface antigen Ly-9-like isoform X2 [Ahaetulla prasina]